MKKNLKPIAITMGDPSGIGPEIIISALEKQKSKTRFIVLGCPKIMNRAIKINKSNMTIHKINNISQALYQPGIVDVLQVVKFTSLPIFGKITSLNGKASYASIKTAIELAMINHVSAIVTAPINKQSLALANIKFPGHTEILAKLSKCKNVAMLLVNKEIKTLLATIHCSLNDVVEKINIDDQISSILFANEGAKSLGIKEPRIAVAGLNPHAGEGGLFGKEEIEIISPAIKEARNKGADVYGPLPGDTVFMEARKGEFDIVVAQYHDQGLIPIKYMGLENGVNITLGLPFIRTSPDHGTAFNIAGKGIADSASMQRALKYAQRLINDKI